MGTVIDKEIIERIDNQSELSIPDAIGFYLKLIASGNIIEVCNTNYSAIENCGVFSDCFDTAISIDGYPDDLNLNAIVKARNVTPLVWDWDITFHNKESSEEIDCVYLGISTRVCSPPDFSVFDKVKDITFETVADLWEYLSLSGSIFMHSYWEGRVSFTAWFKEGDKWELKFVSNLPITTTVSKHFS